jgi:hypothetical protein
MKFIFFFVLLVAVQIIFNVPSSCAFDVAGPRVDDDYYLDIPVTFTCPYTSDDDVNMAANVTDDGAVDDYYGAKVKPDYAAFSFFYAWMCFITVVPLFYFAYNNKIAPNGEAKNFVPESKFSFIIRQFLLVNSLSLSLYPALYLRSPSSKLWH